MKLFVGALGLIVGGFLLCVLLGILFLIGTVGWVIGSALFGPVGGFLFAAFIILFFLAIASEAIS